MSAPLTSEQLAAIREHHTAVTGYAPPPWRWGGSLEAGRPDYYLATEGHGRKYVMGARKAGFSGADLNFPVVDPETGWGLLARGREIAVRERPYRDQIGDIDNPFAEYLKRAPEYIGALLADRDRLAAELSQIDETALDEILSERDHNSDVADELAAAIAAITGIDVGEHGSAHDPWGQALADAKAYTARARAVDQGYDGDYVTRAARVLESAGRNSYAEAVRNLAAITDRLTAELAESERIARDNVLEAARLRPFEHRVDAEQSQRLTAEAEVQRRGEQNTAMAALNTKLTRELEQARQQLADVRKFSADMRLFCSPYGISYGISFRYADQLDALLDAIPAAPVPAPADESWRQYTVERDNSDDGVAVLCREDGDCMENLPNTDGRYLTLGEAVDWAKKHAVSIFHVDPDETAAPVVVEPDDVQQNGGRA